MTITKLKTVGRWGVLTNDLTQVGAHLGGRRVITGMLTGTSEPATIGADEPAPAIVARGSGPRRAPK